MDSSYFHYSTHSMITAQQRWIPEVTPLVPHIHQFLLAAALPPTPLPPPPSLPRARLEGPSHPCLLTPSDLAALSPHPLSRPRPRTRSGSSSTTPPLAATAVTTTTPPPQLLSPSSFTSDSRPAASMLLTLSAPATSVSPEAPSAAKSSSDEEAGSQSSSSSSSSCSFSQNSLLSSPCRRAKLQRAPVQKSHFASGDYRMPKPSALPPPPAELRTRTRTRTPTKTRTGQEAAVECTPPSPIHPLVASSPGSLTKTPPESPDPTLDFMSNQIKQLLRLSK